MTWEKLYNIIKDQIKMNELLIQVQKEKNKSDKDKIEKYEYAIEILEHLLN